MKVPELINEIQSLIDIKVYYKVPNENKIERGTIEKLSYEINKNNKINTDSKLMATIYRRENKSHGYIIPIEDVYLTIDELSSIMAQDLIENYKNNN